MGLHPDIGINEAYEAVFIDKNRHSRRQLLFVLRGAKQFGDDALFVGKERKSQSPLRGEGSLSFLATSGIN